MERRLATPLPLLNLPTPFLWCWFPCNCQNIHHRYGNSSEHPLHILSCKSVIITSWCISPTIWDVHSMLWQKRPTDKHSEFHNSYAPFGSWNLPNLARCLEGISSQHTCTIPTFAFFVCNICHNQICFKGFNNKIYSGFPDSSAFLKTFRFVQSEIFFRIIPA